MLSKRSVLYLCLPLVIFVLLLQFARLIEPELSRHSASAWLRSKLTQPAPPAKLSHPIPILMTQAENKYKQLIGRQSTTLRAAVAEYRRRYGRRPPRGFDEWFAFAHENNVKIIDEYDSLVRDLEPFWNLPGEEIRRRAQQVSEHSAVFAPTHNSSF